MAVHHVNQLLFEHHGKPFFKLALTTMVGYACYHGQALMNSMVK
jgi:hypothetical protein